MQVTKNFNTITDNMQCPCCNAFVADENFLHKLQLLRDLVDVPFYFDRKGGGFYRCRDYNHGRGSPRSFHLLGKAADILTHGWNSETKWKFVREAIRLELSIWIYSAHIHIDNRGAPCKLDLGSYS